MRKRKKRRIIMGVAIAYALVFTGVGLTYSWFVNSRTLASVTQVQEPSLITIAGPNGSEMVMLDLTYGEEDVAEDKTVTINRVISINTNHNEFMLQISHTTNIDMLSFSLYRVVSSAPDSIIASDGSTSQKYYYDSSRPIVGSYINQDTGAQQKLAQSSGYFHDETYGTYNNVQINAEPLYWNSINQFKNNETLCHYVVSITWNEAEKETDLFYLIAKNT